MEMNSYWQRFVRWEKTQTLKEDYQERVEHSQETNSDSNLPKGVSVSSPDVYSQEKKPDRVKSDIDAPRSSYQLKQGVVEGQTPDVYSQWQRYIDNRIQMIEQGDFTRNKYLEAGLTILELKGFNTEVYREIQRRIV